MKDINLLAYLKDEIDEVMLIEEDQDIKLLINNSLQLSFSDEYRYHQTLFLLPSLYLNPNKENKVLVLGGGDGMGVRELLTRKYITQIDLVDISENMIFLAKYNKYLTGQNLNSLKSEKVNIIIDDAFNYVKSAINKYDLIVVDYPDPTNNPSDQINRLYTEEHILDIKNLLNNGGLISMQIGGIYNTPNVSTYILEKLIKPNVKNIKTLKINSNTYMDAQYISIFSDYNLELKNSIPPYAFFNYNSLPLLTVKFKDEKNTIPLEVLINMELHEIVNYDKTTTKRARVLKYLDAYKSIIKNNQSH